MEIKKGLEFTAKGKGGHKYKIAGLTRARALLVREKDGRAFKVKRARVASHIEERQAGQQIELF